MMWRCVQDSVVLYFFLKSITLSDLVICEGPNGWRKSIEVRESSHDRSFPFIGPLAERLGAGLECLLRKNVCLQVRDWMEAKFPRAKTGAVWVETDSYRPVSTL